MESSGFEEQIFGEFSGPLSPIGAKAVVHHTANGHSIQVMLGMPSDACQSTQRLPDVHNLLPGSAKTLSDHYKSLDTYDKLDYQPNGKLVDACYGDEKIVDYKMEYSPSGSKIIEYVNGGGKAEYSPSRIEYATENVFHQVQGMSSSPNRNNNKKSEDGGSSTPNATSTSSTDASSTTNGNKKSEKSKKTDANGGKKKKTR